MLIRIRAGWNWVSGRLFFFRCNILSSRHSLDTLWFFQGIFFVFFFLLLFFSFHLVIPFLNCLLGNREISCARDTLTGNDDALSYKTEIEYKTRSLTFVFPWGGRKIWAGLIVWSLLYCFCYNAKWFFCIEIGERKHFEKWSF